MCDDTRTQHIVEISISHSHSIPRGLHIIDKEGLRGNLPSTHPFLAFSQQSPHSAIGLPPTTLVALVAALALLAPAPIEEGNELCLYAIPVPVLGCGLFGVTSPPPAPFPPPLVKFDPDAPIPFTDPILLPLLETRRLSLYPGEGDRRALYELGGCKADGNDPYALGLNPDTEPAEPLFPETLPLEPIGELGVDDPSLPAESASILCLSCKFLL